MRVHRRLAIAVATLVVAGFAVVPTATAAPLPTGSSTYKVVRVIDGDTVKLSNGTTVRLIGFDTPEKGKCGYAAATKKMKALVLGKKVKVTNPSSVKNTDHYGRALRSISVNGKDVGASMIWAGLANARYDKLDGYQSHPLQARYRSLDKKVHHKCGSAVDKVGEKKSSSSSSSGSSATGNEPWNRPGPDLDCSDIRKKVRITGPDYHRLDADGDGWGCESWG
ncbi:MAG: thermonuclease family protein [Demequina sp.]|nr:thermonuclease family protein [Demequina sp.]